MHTIPTYDSLVRISRVGGRQADGSLMSDAQQRASNEAAIRALGGRVGRVYEALNESGATVFAGEKWGEALERVRRGQSAGVAVAYHDRLGRNVPEAYAYAAQLQLAGGVLIVNGRVLDQDDPTDQAMFGMAMVQARLTYDLGRQRSLRTLAAVQDRGIAVRVPYGYRRNRGADGQLAEPGADPKALVIDPATGPVVRRVFAERADGASWPEIARGLEADGIPSPSGRPIWTSSTLGSLVTNEAYLGTVRVGDAVTEGAHEPLVGRGTFDRARPHQAAPRTGLRVAGVAGGLVVCGTCGRPLAVQARGAGGSTFYACRKVSAGGRCERPVTGNQGAVDGYLDEQLRQLADGGCEVEAVRAHREVAAAQRALVAAEGELGEWVDGSAGFSADVIRRRLAVLTAAVDAAQVALQAAEAVADGVVAFPASGGEWDDLALVDKQAAAARVVDRVELAPFTGANRGASVVAERLRIFWR